MRKITSVLLILLLLLNVMGYYGVFIGLQLRNAEEMIQKIDSDKYSVAESLTIKVPISLPYSSESEEFQRVDNLFEYNGEFYRTVKQRILHDTLSIVCVKDTEGKKIHQALVSYVKSFTDKSGENQTKSKVVTSLSKDYFSEVISIDCISDGWQLDVQKQTSFLTSESAFCDSILLPPRLA